MIDLELFLVTYNRKEHLKRTLSLVTTPQSPLLNYPITVLDNCSTDGTSEYLAEITAKHHNIKHIRHNRNIGGNANIARAFEMAKTKYVWVLCDDDDYDFTHWTECEAALSKNPAAVVVANYLNPQKGVGDLFKQLSFVPAAIYRTDLFSSDTMTNMYFNVSNMFPQLAIAASALNSGEEIIILPNALVTMRLNPGNDSYTRGCKSNPHPLMKNMRWNLGFAQSWLMLTSKKAHKACCALGGAEAESFYNYCGRFMSAPGNIFYLYGQGVYCHTGIYKLLFALLAFPAFICSFSRESKGWNIRLFGRFKTRILKCKSKSN